MTKGTSYTFTHLLNEVERNFPEVVQRLRDGKAIEFKTEAIPMTREWTHVIGAIVRVVCMSGGCTVTSRS